MPEKTHTCAHINCKCRVAEDVEYCSEYCSEGRDITEIGCGCEHPPCLDEL